MTLDIDFSLDELEAAEAATVNPYLSNPEKGLQLLARLLGQPATQDTQRAQLSRLHRLIHQDFIALTANGSYPGEAQALSELQTLEEALENLALFPDLAKKTVVGVGGGFSAGKSRFLNTLLGVDLLPESLEPTTAIPSFIVRGEDEIVALNTFNQRIMLDRDGVQALTHAFHEHYRDNLGEGFGFAHILKLLMMHHAQLPWQNLAFLDTPGYSKADAGGAAQTDQDIALRQLGEADHVLWLLNAKNGSIRQDDLDFLRSLNHPQPIFFVVTQADLVGEARVGTIMDSTRADIDKAGIACAGLIAWAGELGCKQGRQIAGDDIQVWLDTLDTQPKYTRHRQTCEQVLSGYIRHNQNSLASSRKKLTLLNSLLPLADELPKDESGTLQSMIQEQRQSQSLFKEQLDRLNFLQEEMLDAVGAIVGQRAIDMPISDELFQQAMRDHQQQAFIKAAKRFQYVADLGHTGSQYYLGRYYANGLGLPQDEKQAVIWYSKAAEQGHAGAQAELGERYYNGNGVPQDYKAAVHWYRQAAEQGDAGAQAGLGECYYSGNGVLQDYNVAVDWFQNAAEQDHADGQTGLGKCYYFGNGVLQDYNVAVDWFQNAAEQGHADAQYRLGDWYYKDKKSERGFLIFGISIMQSIEDTEAAVRWYRQAAEQGHAGAQHRLGDYYNYRSQEAFGIEYAKDAASWYRKAAEQGHAEAQYRLGECYYEGHGVSKSKKAAVRWYRQAAEQGHADAQSALKARPYWWANNSSFGGL
mgnify:CR=1 FL=1